MNRQGDNLAGSLFRVRQFKTLSVGCQGLQAVIRDRVVHAGADLPLVFQCVAECITFLTGRTFQTDCVLVVDV